MRFKRSRDMRDKRDDDVSGESGLHVTSDQ
jgi:hypothetical protein